MTFPIDVKLEFGLGADVTADPGTWSWTDVTSYWVASEPVERKVGRGSGATSLEAAEFEATIRNNAGEWTLDDPRSARWPDFVEGMPVRWSVNSGAGWDVRFEGFLSGAEPIWPANSSRLSLVKISAIGPSYRIREGAGKVISPLRRAMLANNPGAYWSGEDESGATAVGAATPGTLAAKATDVTFAGNSDLAGSLPLMKLSATSQLVGTVPSGAVTDSEWQFDWYFDFEDAPPDPTETAIMTVVSKGTVGVWQVWVDADTLRLTATNLTGFTSLINVATSPLNLFDGPVHWRLMAEQDGADIDWKLVWFSAGASMGWVISGTLAGTLGAPTAWFVGPAEHLADAGIGHIAVYSGIDVGVSAGAEAGFLGERAVDRIERLCTEAGVALVVDVPEHDVGLPDGPRMGPQPSKTLWELLEECEKVDGGTMCEEGWGLRYVPLAARYNRTPALVLDMAQRQVAGWKPSTEAGAIRNEWEVTREGGGSATAADAEDQKRRGAYDDAVTLRLLDDDQCLNQASWRVHLGKRWGYRYEGIGLQLQARPTLVSTWQAVSLADWLTIANPPPQHPPGLIRQELRGFTERWLGRRSWWVVMATAPSRPFEVFQVEDARFGRIGTALSELNAGIDADDVSLVVMTYGGRRWTLDTTDLPLDIGIGGEQITVTNITGSSSPQTFTVTRSTNGVSRSHSSGAPVDIWEPGVIAL